MSQAGNDSPEGAPDHGGPRADQPTSAAVLEDNVHRANEEVSRRAHESGYLSDVQVYEPHKVGLPPLVPYFTELWHRRAFAAQLSRANMRAANTRTFFGQVWLVINPLLLAAVYFLLVNILRERADGVSYFAHLVAGIFAYYFVSGSISTGASSVTSGGSLIANMAFPRLLMPMAAVRTAFFRFLPTVPVYLVLHLIVGQDFSWRMLLAVYFLGCMILFAVGLSSIFATLQVYFRDTASFLPYFLRIWLYLSPVIWFAEDVPARLAPLTVFNPLFFILGGWSDLLVRGEIPPTTTWVVAGCCAVGFAVIGCLFFMSREREFAVRL